jgi:hypothetical protein
MNEMFPLATPGVANDSRWIALCRSIKRSSIPFFCDVFGDASRAVAETNPAESEVYGLLAQVFSMNYSSENRDEPFGPMIKCPTWRTAMLSDFTDENLALF